MIAAADIVSFWREAGEKAWFAKDDTFDLRCRDFEAAHHAAARGEYAAWEDSAEGALALCLLLDQIPRNIYRNSPHAFATDGLAQGVALRALAARHDAATPMPLRIFFYLPLEHAENMALQAQCLELMRATGVENFVRYAELHRDIIARFGRFPHRNAALGRVSTSAELDFLASGGFAG
ncbi:MAG: DUF924 family protein [Hyphomonadaceae bacterium]|nr:DUF924 family protein [Hyphomonadaceae bacterium]